MVVTSGDLPCVFVFVQSKERSGRLCQIRVLCPGCFRLLRGRRGAALSPTCQAPPHDYGLDNTKQPPTSSDLLSSLVAILGASPRLSQKTESDEQRHAEHEGGKPQQRNSHLAMTPGRIAACLFAMLRTTLAPTDIHA